MEPATGWGVHGGPCVDTFRSVEVKIEELEKTILRELEDGLPVLPIWVVKIHTYEILLNLLVLPESLYVSICWRVLLYSQVHFFN